MKSTFFNVAFGLFGFYIIRDPAAESGLPPRSMERMMLLFYDIHNTTGRCALPDGHSCIYTSEDVFYNNDTYRLRLLNGDFDDFYGNM